MFKFGIFKKAQLTPHGLAGFVNSRKFIALDLYDALDDLPATEREAIQERMLGRFSVRSGVLKYTHARRFEDFDALSLAAIEGSFARARQILVHDIGVSDGRSSCGLYDRLNRSYGGRLNFMASDYAPFLYVLRKERSKSRIIIDEQDHLLQIVTPPFVFIVVRPESRKLYPLNHLMRYLATMFYARPLLKAYKAGEPGIERTRVALLCGECRTLVAKAGNFRFRQYDVLSGPLDRFDVIRAMNVLNKGYFSDAQLSLALGNIALSLNDGGLFITGSNTAQGSTVDGAIYRKNVDRMERLQTSGKGSQIDALITVGGMSRKAPPETGKIPIDP
jgi:hypothetical protein